MKQETFDKFFDRNNKERLEEDIVNGNEYNDEHCNIAVEVIPDDDDYEYGYGRDINFSYSTVKDFIKKTRKDILEHYELEEIVRINLYLYYWSSKDPDDISTIDLDSVG